MRKIDLGRFGVDAVKEGLSNPRLSQLNSLVDTQVKSSYHYTSTKTLDSILNSGCFYSTECHYQNDPLELHLGYEKLVQKLKVDSRTKELKLCKKICNLPNNIHTVRESASSELRPFKNNYTSIYNICFCSKVDDLGQWDRYAGECGVAIEIDFEYIRENAMLALRSISNSSDSKLFYKLEIEPFHIAYDEEDIESLLNTFFDHLDIDEEGHAEFQLRTTLNLLSSHIKDKRYEYENETRLSFYPYKASAVKRISYSCELVYTVDNQRMIPHVPVYCFPKELFNQSSTSDLNPSQSGWPIKKIVVGPGRDQDAVYESLIHRLEAGIAHVFDYGEEEKIRRKIVYYKEIVDTYKKKHRRIKKDMSNIINQIDSIQCDFEKVLKIQSEKYLEPLAEIFIEAERQRYCTAQGIIIEKSDLKYIFKTR